MNWSIFLEGMKIAFSSTGWLIFCSGICFLTFLNIVRGCMNYDVELRNKNLMFLVIVAMMFALYFWGLPKCPSCGEIARQEFCNNCGEVVSTAPTCPECGEECFTNFCGSCGAPMNPEG